MSYFPEFKGPVEGYAVNSARQNVWRVRRLYDIDDLKQEAYEVFLRVASRYQDLEGPAHFMALFKTAWNNHITDLARKDTASRIIVQETHDDCYAFETNVAIPQNSIGDTDNDGYLATVLREAPREISMVLNLFLNAPQEILDIALESWQGRDFRKKTGGSLKICQLLGLDPNKDILKAVEDYLTN